eukprot:UN22666
MLGSTSESSTFPFMAENLRRNNETRRGFPCFAIEAASRMFHPCRLVCFRFGFGHFKQLRGCWRS